jgi:hypothetical protein
MPAPSKVGLNIQISESGGRASFYTSVLGLETAVVMPVPSNILAFVRKGRKNITCADLPISCFTIK